MTRLRTNNISGVESTNAITLSSTSTTSVSWASSPAFATIVAPNYYVIVVQPDTANEEIIYLTAFTGGATSGTVTRAQEGTSGVTYTGTAWVHGPTAVDFPNGPDVTSANNLIVSVSAVSGTGTPTLAVFFDVEDAYGNWVTVSNATSISGTALTATGTTSGNLSATSIAAFNGRIRWTVTGTNPSFTCSLDLFGR